VDDGAALALAARVVLAAVLAGAAVAKLRARGPARRSIVGLVGRRAGPAVAAALPWTELAVAAALVVWWGWLPGAVAAVLLGAFTAIVVRAQLQRVPCACFGSAPGDRPPGAAAVVRNAVLLALAVVATASPSGAGAGPAAILTVALAAVAVAAVRAAR
jgi:hypothetical protein